MAIIYTITGEHKTSHRVESVRKAMRKALKRIAEVHIAASKRDYLSKKKASPKLPSMIFDSFTYELKNGLNNEMVAVVMCGGVRAPHAIYVNYPHRLRNDKVWPGYFFMEKGAAFARAVSGTIIKEELSKRLKV